MDRLDEFALQLEQRAQVGLSVTKPYDDGVFRIGKRAAGGPPGNLRGSRGGTQAHGCRGAAAAA